MPAPKDPIKYKEWIEKLSKSKKGKPNKGHFTKGESPWNKGISPSEETKEKLRQFNLGRFHTEETKRKLSKILQGNNRRVGIKLSEEHKRIISQASKGNKNRLGKTNSEEHNRKIGESHEGKKHSVETRIKMKKAASERMKKYWAKMSDKEKLERCSNWTKAGLKAFKNTTISSLEIKIAKELDILKEPYIHQYEFNGYYIDFYLTKKNQFIECNGIYWHSLPRRIKRDDKIKELCKENNIKLSWLWEDEIKQDAKKALLNALK